MRSCNLVDENILSIPDGRRETAGGRWCFQIWGVALNARSCKGLVRNRMGRRTLPGESSAGFCGQVKLVTEARQHRQGHMLKACMCSSRLGCFYLVQLLYI